MTRQQKQLLTACLVPVELALAVLAWRDITRRPDSQIRGPKKLWRAVVMVHPGNSLLYWLFGRR